MTENDSEFEYWRDTNFDEWCDKNDDFVRHVCGEYDLYRTEDLEKMLGVFPEKFLELSDDYWREYNKYFGFENIESLDEFYESRAEYLDYLTKWTKYCDDELLTEKIGFSNYNKIVPETIECQEELIFEENFSREIIRPEPPEDSCEYPYDLMESWTLQEEENENIPLVDEISYDNHIEYFRGADDNLLDPYNETPAVDLDEGWLKCFSDDSESNIKSQPEGELEKTLKETLPKDNGELENKKLYVEENVGEIPEEETVTIKERYQDLMSKGAENSGIEKCETSPLGLILKGKSSSPKETISEQPYDEKKGDTNSKRELLAVMRNNENGNNEEDRTGGVNYNEHKNWKQIETEAKQKRVNDEIMITKKISPINSSRIFRNYGLEGDSPSVRTRAFYEEFCKKINPELAEEILNSGLSYRNISGDIEHKENFLRKIDIKEVVSGGHIIALNNYTPEASIGLAYMFIYTTLNKQV